MDRVWESGAAGSAPSAPGTPSSGFPTAGNPGTGTPATKPGPWWYHQITEELLAVILAAGLTPDHEDLTQLLDAVNALIAGAIPAAVSHAVIVDEKATGVAGGSFTAGDWRTRSLNTVVADPDAFVALASNQITLPAGDYRFRITAPGHSVNAHQARLYNVTDAAVVQYGTSENAAQAAAGDAITTLSTVVGAMTLPAQKTLEVQHRSTDTKSTDGFGFPAGFGGVEIYTTVELWKTA